MKARIAKKIVTCKSSLMDNLSKLIEARVRLKNYPQFIFYPIKGHDWDNYESWKRKYDERTHKNRGNS